MDNAVYSNTDPDRIYCSIKELPNETQPPSQPLSASFIDSRQNSVPAPPPPLDVFDPNSKHRSHQKSFSGTQVVLIVAVAIFATLSTVFMAMYFTTEGKSKPGDCQNSMKEPSRKRTETANCSNTKEPSRNRTETAEKCKPCVCQNFVLVTNCSKSKNDSMENGQCPVGCVNSTIPKRFTNAELNSTGCADLYKKGERIDGVYRVDPDDLGAFNVRCDMTTNGGGWTVFQRRIDGSVDFYLGWKDYKEGFGNPYTEFWLGLDNIHRLSKSGQNVLRVDLEDFEKETRYAEYSTFAVGNETGQYRLTVRGYSGNAGDGLDYHNRMMFSTKDRDNDLAQNATCAQTFKGAWWYHSCHNSNLNGLYLRGRHTSHADGVNWVYWNYWKGYYYSLKKTEMKIRPRLF